MQLSESPDFSVMVFPLDNITAVPGNQVKDLQLLWRGWRFLRRVGVVDGYQLPEQHTKYPRRKAWKWDCSSLLPFRCPCFDQQDSGSEDDEDQTGAKGQKNWKEAKRGRVFRNKQKVEISWRVISDLSYLVINWRQKHHSYIKFTCTRNLPAM